MERQYGTGSIMIPTIIWEPASSTVATPGEALLQRLELVGARRRVPQLPEHVRVGDEVQGWIGVINRPIRPLPMFPPLRSSRWADLWRWVHDGMRLS